MNIIFLFYFILFKNQNELNMKLIQWVNKIIEDLFGY